MKKSISALALFILFTAILFGSFGCEEELNEYDLPDNYVDEPDSQDISISGNKIEDFTINYISCTSNTLDGKKTLNIKMKSRKVDHIDNEINLFISTEGDFVGTHYTEDGFRNTSISVDFNSYESFSTDTYENGVITIKSYNKEDGITGSFSVNGRLVDEGIYYETYDDEYITMTPSGFSFKCLCSEDKESEYGFLVCEENDLIIPD
jgi:hypothetical protein